MRKIAANKNYINLKKKASPADPNAMNRNLESRVNDLMKRVYELEQIVDSDGYKRSRLNNTVYED